MNPLPHGRGSALAGAAPKTADARTALQRQIDATGRQIDQLVYQFHALTEEETRTVEEATGR